MKGPFVLIRRTGVLVLLAAVLMGLSAPLAVGVAAAPSSDCMAPAAPSHDDQCLVDCIEALTTLPPAAPAGADTGGWHAALEAAALVPLTLGGSTLLRQAPQADPQPPPLSPLGVRLLV